MPLSPSPSDLLTYDNGIEFDLEFDDVNFDQCLDENFKHLHEGEIIKATVVDIGRDFVTVDVGYKSKGMVPVSEFTNFNDSKQVEIGDVVDVFLENRENYTGQIIVSKEKAQKLKIWHSVSEIHDNNGTIEGEIISKIKGGLVVNIGVSAFLPGSQVDLRPIRNLDKLIGERFEFKILKYSLKRGNIVLSRRAYLEIDREDRRKKTIETLEEGSIVTGHVKNITDYGVFVDLGGIDGLLHITDITWGRIVHPSEAFNIGDEVDVLILSYDKTNEKVSLGYKQKSQNPWDSIIEKYKVGDHVNGRIVNIMNYGAFIEIEGGIEGLIHISAMSWTKKIKHPSAIVEIGDTVESVIKEIDLEKKRISLSMKDLQANPWKQVIETTPINSVVDGKVKNVTDFGIFVEIEQGVDGLVHISDMSWSQRLKKIHEEFQKDMSVRVKILDIDVEKGRLSLGIKQLTEDPWKSLGDEIAVGDEVQGQIVHVADFGVFVEIKDGVEGLIHVSEIGGNVNKKQLVEQFKIGEKLFSKVIKIDIKDKKLGLSVSNQNADSDYEYATADGDTAAADSVEKQSDEAQAAPDVKTESAVAPEQTEEPIAEKTNDSPSDSETEIPI